MGTRPRLQNIVWGYNNIFNFIVFKKILSWIQWMYLLISILMLDSQAGQVEGFSALPKCCIPWLGSHLYEAICHVKPWLTILKNVWRKDLAIFCFDIHTWGPTEYRWQRHHLDVYLLGIYLLAEYGGKVTTPTFVGVLCRADDAGLYKGR